MVILRRPLTPTKMDLELIKFAHLFLCIIALGLGGSILLLRGL